MDKFARIQSIEITNFKNVSYGFVDFCNYGRTNENYENNIGAIYGQNGSGKTALIDAISIVKNLILGSMLPSDMDKYVKLGCDTCSINTTFYVVEKKIPQKISYFVEFLRKDDRVIVSKEQIKYHKKISKDSWSNFVEYIGYESLENKLLITPQTIFREISKSKMVEALVAQSLSQRINPNNNSPESTSLIFSKGFIEILKSLDSAKKINPIINLLRNFVSLNLIIIEDKKFGGISENIHAIPIYTRTEIGHKGLAIGSIPIQIDSKTEIPEMLLPIYKSFVMQINTVLPTIIPGITLKMTSIEKVPLRNGAKGITFSMVTIRENQEINLKYESAGIKKILCILSSLIATYNNPDVCFVVDELDSGIFEYLLGQIITVFKKDSKGQLIFTSHNLHVVEILDNESLFFTYFNSKNAYSHLPKVKPNNNKRLLYLKQIELSENGILYNKTNQYEMSFAFEIANMVSKEGEAIE